MSSGYKQGTTKAIVLEANRLGLTREQVMKNTGKTRYAIHACEWRNGIQLKTECKRAAHGSVKDLAIKALDEGLTFKDAMDKYKPNRSSFWHCWTTMGGKV